MDIRHLALTLALFPAPAFAQSAATPPPPAPAGVEAEAGPPPEKPLRISLGVGALVFPKFLGSRTYRVLPVPSIDVAYRDLVTASVQDGLAVNLIRAGGFRAGPIARFRFGQDEKDNRQALRGLGDVGASVELGGFAKYASGPFSAKIVVGQDVAKGHRGGVADLSASYTGIVSMTRNGPVLISLGPSLTAVTARFNRSYFGVDAGQSVRSGLARYSPGGGLENVGASATLIAPFTRRISLIATAGYSRLLDDAADSPRLRRGGSRNQGVAGLFLTYKL